MSPFRYNTPFRYKGGVVSSLGRWRIWSRVVAVTFIFIGHPHHRRGHHPRRGRLRHHVSLHHLRRIESSVVTRVTTPTQKPETSVTVQWKYDESSEPSLQLVSRSHHLLFFNKFIYISKLFTGTTYCTNTFK